MRTPLFLAITALPFVACADDFSDAIDAINAVGKNGEGNAEAATSWKTLVDAGSARLPDLLAALNADNAIASNYIRSATDAITEANPKALPVDDLLSWIDDQSHSSASRHLAFDLLQRADSDHAEALIPTFLEDPANGLRRLAVAAEIEAGATALEVDDKAKAMTHYQSALASARDVDQLTTSAEVLRDEFGLTVDIPKAMGFLTHWHIIGPFDNMERAGFDIAYPPEEEIDLAATLTGKSDELTWSDFTTSDDFGMVDINKAYGLEKEVVAYATTTFTSSDARAAQLRIGCKNGWKVWLNGELLFGRDEYHRGIRIDQYSMPVDLKAGENTILVKLCQNEQQEQWTVEWQFQLRVCDETGAAILATDRPATPEKGTGTGESTQQRRRPQ